MARLTLVVLVFAGLHLIAAVYPELGLWGVDSVAYAPWTTIPFTIATVLLLWPPVQTRMADALVWLNESPWRIASLPAIALALFWVLPVSRHYLGDGELLLRTFRQSVAQRSWRGINAPLPYYVIDRLRLTYEPEAVIRAISVASGVLYTMIAVGLSRRLFPEARERAIVLCLILTPAFVLLFFGYIETYPAIYPLFLAYLFTGLLAMENRCPLVIPSVLMGILLVTHFSLIVLAPSLLVLAVILWRSDALSVVHATIEIIACPLAALALLWTISFEPDIYFEGMKKSHLLPLIADKGYAYGFLSLTHLGNIVNEQLLVAPAVLIVLAAYPCGWASKRRDHLFLLAGALPAVFFTIVANPEIGAFRDWDAFAFPALPLLLLASLVIIRQVRGTDQMRAAVQIGGISAIHTAFWIFLNAQPALAEARYTTLLDISILSPTAQSYGWEAVGAQRRREGDLAGEHHAFEKAAEANPTNYRYWNTLGTVATRRNLTKEAIDYYQRALEANPGSFESHSNIGSAYSRIADYDKAIHHYLEAIQRNPKLFGELYANLGAAFLMTGQLEKSLGAYEEAMTRSPHLVQAYFQAGNAANRLGDLEKARLYYGEVLHRDPGYPHADLIRKWIAEVDKLPSQGKD